MTSAVSIFWIFVLFCLSPGNAGTIDMTFMLTCKDYTNWCANVFVYEEDSVSSHDFLAEKEICTPMNNKKADLLLAFGKVNPGGDTTPTYEIMPLISHNCSKTGEYFCAKPSKAFDVPAWEDTKFDLTIAMSEQGDTKGKCVHPKTG